MLVIDLTLGGGAGASLTMAQISANWAGVGSAMARSSIAAMLAPP